MGGVGLNEHLQMIVSVLGVVGGFECVGAKFEAMQAQGGDAVARPIKLRLQGSEPYLQGRATI